MPPKKRTSVTRKIHIPSDEASFWASRSTKWWRSSGGEACVRA